MEKWVLEYLNWTRGPLLEGLFAFGPLFISEAVLLIIVYCSWFYCQFPSRNTIFEFPNHLIFKFI